MSTTLKLRGGTTAQHSAFTGEAREVTVDTDKNTVVVHDGSTAGGYPLVKEADVLANYAVEPRIAVKPTLSTQFGESNTRYNGKEFVTEPMTDTYTVERSSTATYVDALGKIRTAAVDEPRYTFDPETGEALGLLVEESRTNLLTWSEDFIQDVWNSAGLERDANAITAPDGSLTADRLYTTTTTSYRGIQQARTLSVGLCSPSIFVKKSNTANVSFAFFDNSTATTLARAVYNFDSGTITQAPTSDSVDVKYEIYSNGWVRLYANGCNVTNGNVRLYIYPGIYHNQTVNDDVFIWGAQLEAASTPSSYIPTQASAVTRVADNVSRVLGDEWNRSQGTFLIKGFKKLSGFSVSFNYPLFISSSLTGIGENWFGLNALGSNRFQLRYNSSILIDKFNFDLTDQSFNIAVTYRIGEARLYVNGELSGTSETTLDFSNMVVAKFNTTSIDARFDSHSKDFRYYPKALSEAECIALTKV